MPMLGQNALVLGASMSGLLAARVLAEHFTDVTIVERDVLPDEAAVRRGVPQGRQPHVLLARGTQTFKEFFPGILDELVANGAYVWADGDLSKVYASFSGHEMVHSGTSPLADDDGMYSASRPFLEYHVRRRVQALTNVSIIQGHDVAEMTSTKDRKRITGVRVVDRDSGAAEQLTADLVIDAMGRGAHTPALLESLGYERPVEEHITTHTTYVTQRMRIPADALAEGMVIISPEPGRPTGMFLTRIERGDETNAWSFTVFGMVGHEPPRELDEMVAFAKEYAPAHILAAVQAGQPIAPVAQHRLPSSQWRRYDKMRRFPDGLLVTGDAMCSFNPIYGQGMSVAAMDALALRTALRRGVKGLSRRYFRTAAKSINVAWGLGAGTDLAFPEVQGRRTLSSRLAGRYVDWVLTACESDTQTHAQFLKVTGLVDPPARLFHPAFVYRAATVNLRRGKPALTAAAMTFGREAS